MRDALSALAKEALSGKGKLVPAENLHITLFFLGSVDARQRDCAERAADRIDSTPFILQLNRFGCFPRARVLWSSVAQTPPALVALADQLARELTACGFAREERPYRAHLTLARKAKGRIQETPHESVSWCVRDFHLVESVTDPGGARYRLLQSWSFA